MSKTRACIMAVLISALSLSLAGAASADNRMVLSKGDPPWVLGNLNADRVEARFTDLTGRSASTMVQVTFTKDGATSSRSYVVHCLAPNHAVSQMQLPGWLVDTVSFTCTNNKVLIEVTASGRQY